MFKPFKGPCVQCGHDRWIVVRKGLCKQCNDGTKNKTAPGEHRSSLAKRSAYYTKRRNASVVLQKKQVAIKKGAPKKRFRKPTGEKEIFLEMYEAAIQEASPECPSCRICSDPLGYTPRPIYFSHVLGKLTYVVFRKWKVNIWIVCGACHTEWHNTGRSDLPATFRDKIATELLLKEFYYYTRSIVNYDYELLPETIEEVEKILLEK